MSAIDFRIAECALCASLLVPAFSFTACLAAEGGAQPIGGLPRYALKTGQELHYSGDGSFKYEKDSIDSANDWKIWVTRKNADGSWRLVVRYVAVHGSKDASSEDADVTLAYLDLFPDGRFTENSSFGFHFQPHTLFARLPADEVEVKDGWKSRDETSTTSYAYTAKTPDLSPSAVWQFTCVEENPFNKIYLSTRDAEFTFDRAQGLVRELNTKSTQGWGFHGAGTSQLALKEVADRDADWIASLDRDMDRYLEADKQHEALIEKLELSNEAEARLDQAKELWSKLRGEVTNEVVQQAVDRQIKREDSYRSSLLQGAKDKQSVLGKAAAEWETTDLDGKPHRLADYAGKVVVLDFWYRGCGWCIRSMPQINRVAEDFATEPVAVLGMNTDSNVEDAKFVVDVMKLKYPSMHIDNDLPKKYGVSGFPTLLILDQSGTVRDMLVGYSPTLREDLTTSIRQLLKNKATTPNQSEKAAARELQTSGSAVP